MRGCCDEPIEITSKQDVYVCLNVAKGKKAANEKLAEENCEEEGGGMKC